MSADKGRSQTKAGQSATVSGSVSDLRKLAEERRGGRPNTGKAASATAGEENIPEDDLGSLQEVFRIRTGDAKTAEHKRGGAARRTPQKQSLNNLERPASRAEISALESELEDRIRLVLFEFEQPEEKSNGLYSASKENLRLTRDRMLIELGADVSALELEPWLESFIKCECLKTMCDEVSSKLSDMLSVSSTEFGNVLRKLRMNYKQTFEQMRQSWMKMKQALEHTRLQLKNAEKNSEQLQFQLSNKDNQVQSEFEAEIQRMNEDFKIERAREREKLRQTEFKMDQMSDTLKYLNEIFKTMQADASTAKTADLLSKCQRLEKENKELLEQNAEFDVVKAKLAAAEKAVKDLEANKKIQTEENSRLKLQLIRREEVVTELMEKEALRNAEIEKLQKISKLKDDELVAVDLKDAATSVLCIKCKKSLDDLSNIKSAVMGDAKGNKVAMKLQCEYYRILLPNLRGRRPNRTVSWFRSTLRCILISKMREDVALHAIKGETCRFPAFTYSWFTRDVQAMTESGTVAGGGSQVAKALHMADEDRWGLYYCLKAMSKEDPEAMVFWTLLDETHGEDGVRFILHCLSIILSLAGPSLWKQFGPSFVRCSSINARRSGDDSQENVRPNIWLDIDTAKEAVRCILVRALANSVNDAMDAIDALKVRPSLEDLASLEEFGARSVDIFDVEEAGKPIENSVADAASVESATEISQKSNKENETNINSVDLNKLQSENPTHINLFMWLRLMMQQMHADQIHRGAAIRLMFETASVGALIPQPIIGEVEKGTPFGATGSYVEYPQFQSICQTLFPHLSVAETATLFARCYDAGNHRVTSEVFLKTANWQQLFSQAMRLPILPVLRQHVDQTRGDSKGYSLQTVYLIKNKLTTTIHRKLAAISPSVKVLLNQLPERWRTLLTDAVSQTEVALKDANNAKHYSNLATSKIAASMQTGEEVENGEDAEATITVRYLHGLQPYICYRRLITLATFLKSMCDNPLLPTEVFTLSDLEKNDHHSIHLALTTAEKTLTSLEQGIVVASTSKSLEQMLKSKNSTTALHTYDNFDRVRKNLVARRLQSVVRKFLNADVPVPKAVRLCMPIGYLANSKKKSDKSMSSLKSREIVMEPWWGQSCVAEIFAFKLSYDKKAKALGLPLLSLAQATVSYFYFIYGCLPVAERSVQDLFVAVKTYRLGVPRLKLFAAFVGDSRDLDEGVTEILKAPHAVELYLQLLVEIHKSIATTGARKTEKSAKISELSAMGVVVVNEASSFNMNKDAEIGCKAAPNWSGVIDVLFPASENTFTRPDKREVWQVDSDILMHAVVQWCDSTQRKSLGEGHYSLYTDLVEKLRKNPAGQAEVDDCLYIIMLQWAKLTSWNVKRSSMRSTLLEKDYPMDKFSLAMQKRRPSILAGKAVNSKDLLEKTSNNTLSGINNGEVKRESLSPLPLSNLKAMVESIYRPGEGPEIADPQFYATSYVNRLAIHRSHLLLPVESNNARGGEPPKRSLFSYGMERLLRDCVLWDTNSLSSYHRALLSLSSTAFEPKVDSKVAASVTASGVNSHFLHGNVGPIGSAVNPEIMIAAAKKACQAYQEVINQAITNIASEPKLSGEIEIDRKVQTIRLALLTLSNSLEGQDATYTSCRLYDDSKLLEGPSKEEEIENTSRKLGLAKEVWHTLQSLFTSVAELMISVGEPFPKDAWSTGVKSHVERAYVYNIPTKNSIG